MSDEQMLDIGVWYNLMSYSPPLDDEVEVKGHMSLPEEVSKSRFSASMGDWVGIGGDPTHFRLLKGPTQDELLRRDVENYHDGINKLIGRLETLKNQPVKCSELHGSMAEVQRLSRDVKKLDGHLAGIYNRYTIILEHQVHGDVTKPGGGL